jgi:DNA-binding GntR family transcriptional regulator
MVRPFDFERFNELYDLRTVLETAAVEQLCRAETKPALEDLKATWLVPVARRETDARRVAEMDETFHCRLVAAAGNKEIARVHESVTEQIRVIRRLDFLKEKRIATTYEEHAKILKMIINRQKTEVLMLLKAHIAQSKTEVQKITVHMLHMARESAQFAEPAPKRCAKSSA